VIGWEIGREIRAALRLPALIVDAVEVGEDGRRDEDVGDVALESLGCAA
jgi:hypothetical protein